MTKGLPRRSRDVSAASVLVALMVGSASGQQGGSLEFDGTSDRVTVPYDSSFPTETFSICAWIKATPSTHRGAIIARGEDDNSWDLSWQLYLEPSGSLRIMIEDAAMQNHCYPYVCFSPNLQENCSLFGALQVADDSWHHVAATRTASGELAMYVDGVLVAECSGTGVPSADNAQDLTIGCTHGYIGPPPGGEEPPIWFFSGRIDEPAMWSRSMSPSELEAVFSSGVDPQSADLVGYWAFDEASGQAVGDGSPQGNAGFLGAEPEPDAADPIRIAGDPSCPGDFDGSGTVDGGDLATILIEWGRCEGCSSDLNGDGIVDAGDLGLFLVAWGPCS